MIMQKIKPVQPIDHPLAACIVVPGSKSHTNRALLLAALSQGTTRLKQPLFSDDSKYFAGALRDLGFEITKDLDAGCLEVRGLGGRIPVAEADLFIGNAGTAARFLTAMLTLGRGRYQLDGVVRMRQRPIGDLVGALNNLGASVKAVSGPATVQSQAQGRESLAGNQPYQYPPVTVQAAGLSGGATTIRGDTSSQFLSAILMVAPQASKPVDITITGPLNSRPYIDLTLDVMADFGVCVRRQGYRSFHLEPQPYRSPGEYWIEGDASSASYFFAAPAICGGWVMVENISRASRQGDIAFVDILTRMGCSLSESGGGLKLSGTQQLLGVEVDMADISDTAMTLAVVAPFAATPTTIRNIASSRLKETDRIKATCTQLRRLGVYVEEYPDGMKIFPCNHFLPATIRTYDDHRIAMAFSLVGLRLPGVQIENPACVAKTFPSFFKVLDGLR
jgi:3-phosphoshikimate 1-carboxyvinyltransferase